MLAIKTIKQLSQLSPLQLTVAHLSVQFLEIVVFVVKSCLQLIKIKMNYSTEEMVDMIYILGECQRNCMLASRVYAQRFPFRRHPLKKAFERVAERFNRTGSVCYTKPIRQKPVMNEETEFTVMAAVVETPSSSSRDLSRTLDVSRTTVRRVIKKNRFHPYHYQMHQDLKNEDFGNRVVFCQWLVNKLQEDGQFLEKVLFTDEATFHKNGFVNRHNFHYYSDVNPHLIRPLDHQHRWSLNVWAGIVGSYVIGPFFFEETVTGAIFRQFLENHLDELLLHIPQHQRETMWFQLDGAPAHYDLRVRNFLNIRFGERWIGRGGPINWPARSPDITPLDFFLWGFIKSKVYKDPPTTVENMKERITASFRTVTPQMLYNVRQSILRRARKCIEENGRHFEHLL